MRLSVSHLERAKARESNHWDINAKAIQHERWFIGPFYYISVCSFSFCILFYHSFVRSFVLLMLWTIFAQWQILGECQPASKPTVGQFTWPIVHIFTNALAYCSTTVLYCEIHVMLAFTSEESERRRKNFLFTVQSFQINGQHGWMSVLNKKE